MLQYVILKIGSLVLRYQITAHSFVIIWTENHTQIALRHASFARHHINNLTKHLGKNNNIYYYEEKSFFKPNAKIYSS